MSITIVYLQNLALVILTEVALHSRMWAPTHREGTAALAMLLLECLMQPSSSERTRSGQRRTSKPASRVLHSIKQRLLLIPSRSKCRLMRALAFTAGVPTPNLVSNITQ